MDHRPVRLLVADTFATGTYSIPIASGWVSPADDLMVELVKGLAAADVSAGDTALLPSSELLHLQQSHCVVGEIAVVSNGLGAIVMRSPVRPDEIEITPVRLLDTSGTAELLAQATLKPFYGIETAGWVRDGDAPDAARAQVVIVEGAEALREPEGGFSEDLSRAWFILTERPVVSHVLLSPRDVGAMRHPKAVAFLDAARAEGVARRREWRSPLADREGIARERASAFWAAQRLALEPADRQSLLELLRKGSWGTSGSPPTNVEFTDETGSG